MMVPIPERRGLSADSTGSALFFVSGETPSPRFCKGVLLALLAVLVSSAQGGAKLPEKAQAFFQEHCIRCHGPEKEKGSLRVDQLVADLDDHYSLSHFQNIIDELTVENMPPEDE